MLMPMQKKSQPSKGRGVAGNANAGARDVNPWAAVGINEGNAVVNVHTKVREVSQALMQLNKGVHSCENQC
jgi:hypothetical protein